MAIAELDLSTRESYEGYVRRTIVPALGKMELRKLRGPILDTFYARLRRCSDVGCTGRPFVEHRNVPILTVDPRDRRPGWRQIADTITEAVAAGQLAPGEQLPSVRDLAACQGLRTATLQQAAELSRDSATGRASTQSRNREGHPEGTLRRGCCRTCPAPFPNHRPALPGSPARNPAHGTRYCGGCARLALSCCLNLLDSSCGTFSVDPTIVRWTSRMLPVSWQTYPLHTYQLIAAGCSTSI